MRKFPFSRDKAFYLRVLALSWPVIVQNLINSGMSFLDSFMVGVLGERYLAGVTLANTVFFIVTILLFGIQSGCSVLIAQYHGKGDYTAVNRVMGIAFGLSFAVSMAVSAAVFCFPAQVYGLTSSDPELVAVAAEYGRYVAFSAVLNAVSMIYLSAMRSMERPRVGMTVLGVSVGLNTFLNWVLIFGHLGLPAMGVKGAALATLLSRAVELIITFVYAFNTKKFRLQLKAITRPGVVILKDFLRYSLPVVFNELGWGFGFSLYTVIFGHMRDAMAAVAAFTITINVERMLSALYFGVGQAASVIVGKELGAGRRDGAYTAGCTMLMLTAAFGLLATGVMLALNYTVLLPVVFPLFGASPLTVEIGSALLLIMALSLPFRSFNFCVIVGVLRGGGDARAGMIIDLLCMYGVAIPLAALTGLVFHAPAALVYLMMSMEEFAKAVPGMWRFRRKMWLQNVTRELG